MRSIAHHQHGAAPEGQPAPRRAPALLAGGVDDALLLGYDVPVLGLFSPHRLQPPYPASGGRTPSREPHAYSRRAWAISVSASSLRYLNINEWRACCIPER